MFSYLAGLTLYIVTAVVTYLVTYSGPWLDLYARIDTGQGANRPVIQILFAFRWWVIAYVMAFAAALLTAQLAAVDAEAFAAARWGMMTVQLLFASAIVLAESISGPLEIALKGPGGLLASWMGAADGWHLLMAARLCHSS